MCIRDRVWKDWFQTLPDFNASVVRKGQALSDYACDPLGWRKKCVINIAKAGLFSSCLLYTSHTQTKIPCPCGQGMRLLIEVDYSPRCQMSLLYSAIVRSLLNLSLIHILHTQNRDEDGAEKARYAQQNGADHDWGERAYQPNKAVHDV